MQPLWLSCPTGKRDSDATRTQPAFCFSLLQPVTVHILSRSICLLLAPFADAIFILKNNALIIWKRTKITNRLSASVYSYAHVARLWLVLIFSQVINMLSGRLPGTSGHLQVNICTGHMLPQLHLMRIHLVVFPYGGYMRYGRCTESRCKPNGGRKWKSALQPWRDSGGPLLCFLSVWCGSRRFPSRFHHPILILCKVSFWLRKLLSEYQHANLRIFPLQKLIIAIAPSVPGLMRWICHVKQLFRNSILVKWQTTLPLKSPNSPLIGPLLPSSRVRYDFSNLPYLYGHPNAKTYYLRWTAGPGSLSRYFAWIQSIYQIGL